MLKKSLKSCVSGLFFLSLILLTACKSAVDKVYTSYTLHENTVVDSSGEENIIIRDFIVPYKNHVDEEMNKILSYAPETMDKTQGVWETTIGNLLAESAVEMVEPVFYQRTGQHIDACMFNHGGIRAVISEGNVYTRTAYEVMPFENEAVVLKLSSDAVRSMAQYVINKKRAHPLANVEIEIDKNQEINQITINGKLLQKDRDYYILTSDYLANGGDEMYFFTQAKERIDMNYKLRNVLIDYFGRHDTLPVIKTQRVIRKP